MAGYVAQRFKNRSALITNRGDARISCDVAPYDQVVYPSGAGPSLFANFATGYYYAGGRRYRSLTDWLAATGLSVTAATARTYCGKDGLLKTAAIGEARFAYNPASIGFPWGLQTGFGYTNAATFSEDLTNAAWTKSGATATKPASILDPTGANGTNVLTESSGGTYHAIERSFSGLTGNAWRVTSRWVSPKATGDKRWLTIKQLSSPTTATFASVRFDPTDGTFSSPSTAGGATQAYFSEYWAAIGMWRVHHAVLMNNAETTAVMQDLLSQAATGNYSGDGVSGLNLWGYQLVNNSRVALAYVPAPSSSTVTVAQDLIDGSIPAAILAASEFTLYVRAMQGEVSGVFVGVLAMDDDASFSNEVNIIINDTAGAFYAQMYSGTAIQFNPATPAGNVGPGSFSRVAARYKLNDCAVSVNGAMPSTDAVATMPVGLSKFRIGKVSGRVPHAFISQVGAWPRGVANADLQIIGS